MCLCETPPAAPEEERAESTGGLLESSKEECEQMALACRLSQGSGSDRALTREADTVGCWLGETPSQ